MKSLCCIESSLDKAQIDLARLPLGFWNDSGTFPELFRYDPAKILQPILRKICVKLA